MSTAYFVLIIPIIAGVAVLSFLLAQKLQRNKMFKSLGLLQRDINLIDLKSNNRLTIPLDEDFTDLTYSINDLLNKISLANSNNQNLIAEQENSYFQNFLKSQINAHFIVNTLSSINIFVQNGLIKESETSLLLLSDIVRYAFNSQNFIFIWDEFIHLQKYTDIMNMSYNNKITLNIEPDDELMEITIPRMLLQPIIENCIVHGFNSMDSDCLITISADLIGNKVEIVISDNGCGINKTTLEKLNSQQNNFDINSIKNIALMNIKRRLTTLCEDGEFSVSSVEGKGTTVRISFVVSDT